MNVTLQRHCAKYIYIVPEGLRELMSDISREVLRSQPKDIYTFIADYLDALMITRENARVAARFVQQLTEIAETTVELLENTGMSREEADSATAVIQNAFLNYAQKKGILKEDEDAMVNKIIEDAQIADEIAEDAAVVIQNAFHEFKQRHDREKRLLTGFIDWRIAARSAIKLYRKTGVSIQEAKRAATMIKAAYKGYYTRRTLLKLKEATQLLEEQQGVNVSIAEQDVSISSEHSASVSLGSKKAVRIDYTSVVPHVDFGDNVEIGDHQAQVIEKPVEIENQSSCEIFIREMIADKVEKMLSTIPEEHELELTETEDEDVAEVVEEAVENDKIADVTDGDLPAEAVEETAPETDQVITEEPQETDQVITEEPLVTDQIITEEQQETDQVITEEPQETEEIQEAPIEETAKNTNENSPEIEAVDMTENKETPE